LTGDKAGPMPSERGATGQTKQWSLVCLISVGRSAEDPGYGKMSTFTVVIAPL
jgi:hypothetical protein